MEDHGKGAEDAVEELCRVLFLSDFTVRNPKFSKGSRPEKEEADFLVPFGTTLLAFQVKSRSGRPASESDETYLGRIQKRIEEGVEQLKTIKRALAGGHISRLRNRVGVDLPF